MVCSKKRLFTLLILIICFGMGAALRLVWVEDMEWKGDEIWMFEKAQKIAETHQWPSIGMSSGVGVPNPGLSVWLFAIFSHVAKDPISLTRCVQLLNILALIGFLIFIHFRVEESDKKIWCWGLALASVSPLAILFARKIWAQDLLPFFVLCTIVGHAYRHTWLGAFIWGGMGALLGQIHMSGFFHALGLVLTTILFEKHNRDLLLTRWWAWFFGSVLGGIFLIPWVIAVWNFDGTGFYSFERLLMNMGLGIFYLAWFCTALGIGLRYSMHREFIPFLKEPFVSGFPTYLSGFLHIFLAGVGVWLIYTNRKQFKPIIKSMIAGTGFKNLSVLNFYLTTCLLGTGLLLTLGGTTIHLHYLIIVFPFMYLGLAKLLIKKEKLLLMVVLSQLLISIMFLNYVHIHDGVQSGDYGKAYRTQIEKGKLP